MKTEQIAELCYEVNRAICLAADEKSTGISAPQKPWATADSYQRTAVRTGVGNQLNDPVSMPEDSHNRWIKHMEAEGWTYGERKDSEKRTHPCLVPFSELPLEQRVKDYVFLAIVDTCGLLVSKNSALN